MSRYELDLIIENSSFAHRQQWLMTRQQMYVVAQVNTRKNLKPTDVMTFEWEEKAKRERDRKASSNAEKQRLQAIAKRLENNPKE